MSDFPASLGRRPVTFAQLKQHTNLYRKLKPCRKNKSSLFFLSSSLIFFYLVDASSQFFEERSSRRQRQQIGDYPTHQSAPM